MTSTQAHHLTTVGIRLVTLATVALGCAQATFSPDTLPQGAIPYAAPESYRAWWTATEACSGLTGDFERISWYTVPEASTMETEIGEKVGLWSRENGRTTITLAGEYVDHELVVRHEMLHELLGRDGHPADYFVERCGLTWDSWQASGQLAHHHSSS